MKQGLLKIGLFLFAICSFGFVQAQETITGTVTDGEMPLPGVNVVVKGTSNGTVTDFDGNYSLDNVPGDGILVFSFVGFAQQEISVDGRTTINATMAEDASALSEVVVIGYGNVERRDATGAVSTVSTEDFNRGVVASPEELIQGRTAGLQVTTTSGEPGGGVNIRIRGTTSVRGGNDPLFVVDGVPLSGDDVSAGGTNAGFGDSSPKNPLNFLNPQDIESMSVLKDASATAIYGSRGANGVVIITTKSGRGMQARFDYSANLGVATPANKYDLLDREEWLEAYSDTGLDADVLDYGGDTDWQDEIMRTAFTQEHNLSYSNSYDQGNYRASIGYSDLMGIVENSSMERLSGRLNVNHRLFDDKLKLGLQTSISRVNDQRAPISNNAGSEGDLIGATYMMTPTSPSDPDFYEGQINPNAMLKYVSDETETDRFLINFSTEYSVLENLSAKLNLGYDKAESYRGFGISGDIVGVGSAVPGNGRSQINEIESTNTLLEFTLNYELEFENSKLDVLAGYSYQEFDRQGINAQGWGFESTNMGAMVDDLQRSRNILEGSINGSYQQYGFDSNGFFVNRLFPEIATDRPNTPSGINVGAVAGDTFHTTDELQSFFGRLNYSIAEKYLFTATLRADGSTRFGGNNQYGYFPSGAFAWQLGDEDFVPETFSTLKLRLGYGVTGNQEIPYNLYTPRDRFGGIGISDGGTVNVPGTGQVTFRNADLKWEETSQTNIGLDFGFLQDRLSGSLDFYRKNTTDLLFQTFSAQPAAQDFVWENLDANVINEGVEFSIDYDLFQEEDFYWNLGFNISYNENMVEDFDGAIQTGGINGQGLTNAYAQLLAEGQPLFSYYLREFGGFDESGQTIYPNGDVQEFVGKSALPTTNLGVSTRIEYKNWDLSTFLTGQFDFWVYNNTENAFFTAGSLGSGANVTSNVIGNGESVGNAPDVSTRFLEKGDFLRLQNATLGYNFEVGENSFLNALRVSLTGQNLFLITNYSGLDPEVNTDKSLNGIPTAGIEYTSYPRARTVTLGVNLSF
ncbi:iron complex outermembrane recepter protein [Salegentibacter agarivorans]|uniref:Iron complex outermembrane recepter protein n=1 Tax=Salegentibacter agarivorans TaxID=345907 RepID=A0A1I2ML88_9FLAO|nr:TonB-dependent receptor [Salegentibacter agarivorans]SFF91858.1 iron complex outermembrane recepter protein [Salegentibacter agarivorans]